MSAECGVGGLVGSNYSLRWSEKVTRLGMVAHAYNPSTLGG